MEGAVGGNNPPDEVAGFGTSFFSSSFLSSVGFCSVYAKEEVPNETPVVAAPVLGANKLLANGLSPPMPIILLPVVVPEGYAGF